MRRPSRSSTADPASTAAPAPTGTPAFAPSARSQVPPFTVMSILGRVAELRAAGHDVVSLCAGEPGGGAPPAVDAAAAAVHASGRALTYTPALGLPELRAAVAGHYRRWYGLDVRPEQVAITTGSSGAFMLAFLAAFSPGDRVLLPRPGYPAYRNILAALGVEVADVDVDAGTRYQPTVAHLEAALAEGPVAGLVLASPANPTGTMVSADELAELARWCEEHGVRLVSDEIYHGIVHTDGQGPGACAWRTSRTALVVSSFSKYWGMPGWRLGWMLMPDDLAAAVDGLAGSVALCPPAAAQEAAVHAFSEESYAFCAEQAGGFTATRGVVLATLPRLGWADAAPADGAFYLWARLAPGMLAEFGSAVGYCAALLEEAGVALTPGDDFDAVHGPESVRLSFAAGPDAVHEALERIAAWHAARGLA
ncbi:MULTISPECIES: aminotransferase class I/II-fold pyridoxal phosphate-dependent enzyme [Micrococcus]|uniref:aminotransferase class I/II-fold pyridoxal phosphate-dependent enzyme n=1 Tax=Micrococcus TaxID=1269 RepID=UPI00077DFC3A|nr:MULTISPECIES: aminotransferase class I/II-fold pyridoxal phosphate-dependent enzyme [Micrococcus]KYK03957.1 aspartate aminotransferase [Micrococcus sp. CH3]KYK05934.1 aspartate aminotransferase [Micrococcus sp. CH7]MCF8560298.1 aminotransferase class I/II-fold pyridoxal phosphate-dependent enzyme [Micrococcus yunnanensis]WHM16310.1 aminotransferase class I/II-fold pyridoxal phosphate-dependent enzyme [Micrococcus yunnanensis]